MSRTTRTLALCACVLLLPTALQAQEGEAEPPTTSTEEEEADLWEQAQELYDRARAAGEQVPGTLVEWVRQDVEKMGDWEYRVVSLSGDPESMEQELNELGRERWECFSVQPDGKQTRFFLKRPAKSYVGSVPISTLLKLLPGLGDGESAP